MEAIIRTNDKKLFYALIELLKCLPSVTVEITDEKEIPEQQIKSKRRDTFLKNKF